LLTVFQLCFAAFFVVRDVSLGDFESIKLLLQLVQIEQELSLFLFLKGKHEELVFLFIFEVGHELNVFLSDFPASVEERLLLCDDVLELGYAHLKEWVGCLCFIHDQSIRNFLHHLRCKPCLKS
jgi:hypothetical protein